MTLKENESFFKLLRLALGAPLDAPFLLSDEEWARVYEQADKQSLLGVVFSTVQKLPPESRPPMSILFQWSSEAETVKGLNRLMNKECARLTELFESVGRSTAILKGQANARLYPDPLSRQPGDIDIWVSGGEKSVKNLLQKMGVMNDVDLRSFHHVHMHANEEGVDVEVHFRPSSGNFNLITSRRLLKYLDKSLKQVQLVDGGFYVPSIKFALAMQLSHIFRHFMSRGVGLRQLMDYYWLLKNSTEEDRKEIASLLRRFGMKNVAGAVMWVMEEVFHLDENLMLCRPDKERGQWLLAECMRSGNFGKYVGGGRMMWLAWWLNKHKVIWRNWRFDLVESIWSEVDYWRIFVHNIPVRIKLGKFSLRDVDC